jgi:Winged helix-turn helix
MILLREDGKTQPEIAERTGVSLSTVNRAHMAYDNGGVNALRPKPTGGRRNENMTLEEERKFLSRFAKVVGGGELLNIRVLVAWWEMLAPTEQIVQWAMAVSAHAKEKGRHGLAVKAHGLAMTALGYMEPRRARMPRDRTGKAKELGLVNSVQTVVDGVAAAGLGGLAQAGATIVADAAGAQKRLLARWKENKANGRELNGAVKCKPVLCVNTGITYPSIGQAARDTGYSACRISAACNGRGSRSTFVDGLEFRFAEIAPAIEKAAGPDARSTMRERRLRRLGPAVQTCEV